MANLCDRCYKKPYYCDARAHKGGSDTIGCTGFRPQTNADRIRAMSDEELAKTLNCIPNSGGCIMGNYYDMDCERCLLEWLKKEVEDERL